MKPSFLLLLIPNGKEKKKRAYHTEATSMENMILYYYIEKPRYHR